MNLIAVAKSLKAFTQKNATLEAIYKEICSNKSIPFGFEDKQLQSILS